MDAFDFGPESVTILAESTGIYRIDLVPAAGVTTMVKGAIVVESVETLKPGDDQRARAEDLASRSKQLINAHNEPTAALKTAILSLEAWRLLGDSIAEARTRLRIGDLHVRRNNWEDARSEYLKAQALCTALENLRCTAEAANNIGLVALNLSNLDEALSEFQIASEGWKRLHIVFGEAVTRSNLGLLYWQTSEWQQALREYQQARELMKGQSSLFSARVLNNLGLVYLSMDEFDTAASYFGRALALASGAASRRDAGRFRMNLGRAHMLAGRLANGLVYEQRALATLKSTEDSTGVADVYNNIGQIQLRMNRPTEARDSLTLALTLYRELGNLRGLASALHYLGVAAARMGDLSLARLLLEQALKIREDRRLQDEAAETLYRLALVERKAHRFEEAILRIKHAMALTESLRLRVAGEPLRRAYFAAKQTYSNLLIEILMSQRTVSSSDSLSGQAFAVIERARARALIDLLGEDQAGRKYRADPELQSRQRSVRRRLNFMSTKLAALVQNKPDAAGESAIRREVDELLAEDAEIEGLLREKSRKFGLSAEPDLIELQEIRQDVLGQDDVLVEYFLGETASYSWIVSRDSVRVESLPPAATIERLARVVIESFEDVQGRKRDSRKNAEFTRSLKRLAEILGVPYGVDKKYSRLLIVPDGILHRVPFAALPTGAIDTDRASGGTPLGLRYELVQAPSSSVFKVLQARRKTAPELTSHVTAFADPAFSSSDSRVTGKVQEPRASGSTLNTAGKFELPRLPFTQLEAEEIQGLVPPSQLTMLRGFEATKAGFLGERTWRSSLVLASTHAFTDDVQPELSSIVFSMTARDGRPVDGLVRLYDVYDLNIQSSFVVLSACETARGRQVRGEGLVGISRGFLAAGASGLLAPLNKVDEAGTAALITEFLRGTLGRAKLGPGRALLQARTRLARSPQWKDPYYWSSFVLTSGWD